MTSLRDRFDALLRSASGELYEGNPTLMSSGELIPTPNVIDEGDLELFFTGVDAGLIELFRGGRFNTQDRPTALGHWALLSRSADGGSYDAEYLPQLAAYVDAIVNLRYPSERVLFELPPSALQLDLAILDDDGRVVVLGEAKREAGMLPKLAAASVSRFIVALNRRLAWCVVPIGRHSIMNGFGARAVDLRMEAARRALVDATRSMVGWISWLEAYSATAVETNLTQLGLDPGADVYLGLYLWHVRRSSLTPEAAFVDLALTTLFSGEEAS